MLFIFIILLAFSLGRFIDLSPLCVTSTSPWYTLLTFHFVHAQWHHLAVNLFLFVFYWRYIRHSNYRYSMPIIIFSSIVAAMASRFDAPTAGCSAIVMAMAGVLVATLKRKLLIKNIVLFVVVFLITSLATHINTSIHVYAFFIALLLTRLAGNKRICRRR